MGGEAQVLVGLSLEPPTQARWTILIRLILVIPLGFVAIFIGIAALFAAIGAWFASLVVGRVPDSLQTFMTGALRLYANILAYAFLLTSRWPGLVFDEGAHDQVSLSIDHVPLNRAAVFFRSDPGDSGQHRERSAFTRRLSDPLRDVGHGDSHGT